MKNSFAKLLAWLPCFILLVVAANHFILTNTQHLSPWLGGGFGMFASTDVGPSRWIEVTAISKNGDETPVRLKRRYKDLKHKARALPNSNQLDALAQVAWKQLNKDTLDKIKSPITSIRIEVWKTHFDENSLRPQQTKIALKTFNFNR